MQVWKEAGLDVGAWEEHLISSVAPRLLAGVLTRHHQEESVTVQSGDLLGIVTALGVYEAATLLQIASAIKARSTPVNGGQCER